MTQNNITIVTQIKDFATRGLDKLGQKMDSVGQRSARAGSAFNQGMSKVNTALMSSSSTVAATTNAQDKLEKKLIRVTAAQHEAGAAAAEAARKMQEATMSNTGVRLDTLQQKLNIANKQGDIAASQKLGAEVNRLNAGYSKLNAIKNRYASIVDKAKIKVNSLTSSLRNQVTAFQNLGKSVNTTNMAMGRQVGNMSAFSRNAFPMMGSMNAIMGMQGAMQGSFMSTAFSMLFVNQSTIIWTASLIALGAGIFGVMSAVKRFSVFENLQDKLRGVIRDSKLTGRVWEWLESFRIKSPFDRADIVEGAIVAKRASLDLRKWSESVGNIAAANEEQFASVYEKIGRIARDTRRDSGRLALSDLIGIGITREMLQEYGVLMDEAGLIASDTKTLLDAVHKIGLKEFAGEMQKDLSKIDIQWNKTKEAISDTLLPLGEKWLPAAKLGFHGLIFATSMAVNVLDAFGGAVFYIGRMIKPALDWLGLLFQTIKKAEFFDALVQGAKEFADGLGGNLTKFFSDVFLIRIENLKFKLGIGDDESYELEGIDIVKTKMEDSISSGILGISAAVLGAKMGGLRGIIIAAIGLAIIGSSIAEQADDISGIQDAMIEHVETIVAAAALAITAISLRAKMPLLGAAVFGGAALAISGGAFSDEDSSSIADKITDGLNKAMLLITASSLAPAKFKKSVFAGVAAAIIASQVADTDKNNVGDHLSVGVAAMIAAFSIENAVKLGLAAKAVGTVSIGATILGAFSAAIVGAIIGVGINELLTDEQKETLKTTVGENIGAIIIAAIMAGVALIAVGIPVGTAGIILSLVAGIVAGVLGASLTKQQEKDLLAKGVTLKDKIWELIQRPFMTPEQRAMAPMLDTSLYKGYFIPKDLDWEELEDWKKEISKRAETDPLGIKHAFGLSVSESIVAGTEAGVADAADKLKDSKSLFSFSNLFGDLIKIDHLDLADKILKAIEMALELVANAPIKDIPILGGLSEKAQQSLDGVKAYREAILAGRSEPDPSLESDYTRNRQSATSDFGLSDFGLDGTSKKLELIKIADMWIDALTPTWSASEPLLDSTSIVDPWINALTPKPTAAVDPSKITDPWINALQPPENVYDENDPFIGPALSLNISKNLNNLNIDTGNASNEIGTFVQKSMDSNSALAKNTTTANTKFTDVNKGIDTVADTLSTINEKYVILIEGIDKSLEAIVDLGNRIKGVTVEYTEPRPSSEGSRVMAKGGIVRHPTLIMAGEVPEAIVKLSDRGNGLVADEGIDNGGGSNITVNVTGNTFVGSDPATATKLADIVSEKIMRQLGSFSRISLSN